jgi:ribosomal protein S18 acetylase RimI-like enzyme
MESETPLTHASAAELTAAVEENLFALFRAMAGVLPGSELIETGGLSRHLAFPHNPMFKGAWRTHLAPGEVDDAIDETIAWFQARQAPFFFWWTGPTTQPNDLGERLARRGLITMEEQQKELARGIVQTAAGAPGMVADLSQANEAALEQTPPGFTIEEILDQPSLQAFKKVFVEAYEIPEWAGQAWVDAALNVGIGRTPWKMYLGRLNGQPVATTMLFTGGGVASVYGVATLPAARGKGIGGAITLKPLLQARAAGYNYAVLFSSEMGIHAYERIGFRLTDSRINRYLWRNV